MSELPPSVAGASPAEPAPEEILQQGLMALKQKAYPSAIPLLAKLSQNLSASSAVRLKARIALIKALIGQGQTERAIALTEPLSTHPQPKVQQWAQATLAQLNCPPAPAAQLKQETDLTGFQPLAPEATLPVVAPVAAPPQPIHQPSPAVTENLSGFQPLANAELTTASEGAIAPSGSPSQAEPTVPAPSPPSLPATTGWADSPPPQPPLANAPSLFHYDQLNQTGYEEEPTATATAPTEAMDRATTALPPAAEDAISPVQFHYGGRLERLQPVPEKPGDRLQVWVVQAITAGVLLGLCRELVQWFLIQVSKAIDLFRLDGLLPFYAGWFYREHTVLTGLLLVGLLLASPWLLDWLFSRAYGMKSLPIPTLKQSHPEACRLMRRVSQEQNCSLPTLTLLPTPALLIFSYGWSPRYGRLVLTQGLLDELTDEELATLVGYELAHFKAWSLPLMSLVAVLLQLTYQSYWQTAQWGDRQPNRVAKTGAAALSAISYSLFWLFRKVSLMAARTRVLGSDRQAVEWTGNPNGLVRALIKLTTGMAQTIAQQGGTPPLLESTDLLTPCGYTAAISIGSLFPDPAFLAALHWDIQNPYRHWLAINNSHPPLGQRLRSLNKYSARWRLVPEIPFPTLLSPSDRHSGSSFQTYWFPFLQQISPYIGPVVGVALALLLWFLSGLLTPLRVPQLSAFYGDTTLLRASLFLGLGIGIMLRLNRYFPDILASNRQNNPPLGSLVANPLALPTDSKPVRLEGVLLGRPGMANWFCQDLILKTSTGLVKLHFFSVLGAFGNLLIHPYHPSSAIGQTVTAQGWFRKGATAWLDLEQLLRSGKVIARANHPLWSALLSITFCGIGLLTILRG